MAKDVPRQLVPVVVNYYFIDTLHVSYEINRSSRPLEAAKSSKTDFTSHVPQWLQIFTRSPYSTIMLQNILKKHEIFHFESNYVGGAPGKLLEYYII